MRANVLEVEYLPDQHLVAEYREVKMGPPLLSRVLNSKRGLDKNKIPKLYKLGKGHSYFLLDKNLYLEKRLKAIVSEMKKRNIKTDSIKFIKDKDKLNPLVFNAEFWKDYVPTVEAKALNLERINEKFKLKKDGWYRFYGRPVKNMIELVKTRKDNKLIECSDCKAINIINSKCWKCDTDISKLKYINYIKELVDSGNKNKKQ